MQIDLQSCIINPLMQHIHSNVSMYFFSGSSARSTGDHNSYMITHSKVVLGDKKSLQSKINLQARQEITNYF